MTSIFDLLTWFFLAQPAAAVYCSCTKFGVDSSSRFHFRSRTHRHTVTHSSDQPIPTVRLLPAWAIIAVKYTTIEARFKLNQTGGNYPVGLPWEPPAAHCHLVNSVVIYWTKSRQIYRHNVDTSLGWYQRTARRVASHPVVFMLCTKLDAECDRQMMVVGRLFTTWRRSTCRREIIQSLGKASL